MTPQRNGCVGNQTCNVVVKGNAYSCCLRADGMVGSIEIMLVAAVVGALD